MTPTSQQTSADGPGQSARILVGVDGSQGSLNALLWALGEARARKIPVHAVFAWNYHPTWVVLPRKDRVDRKLACPPFPQRPQQRFQ